MGANEYLESLEAIKKKMDKALHLNNQIMHYIDILTSWRQKIDIEEYFKDDPDQGVIEANEKAAEWNELLDQKRDRLWEHHKRVAAIANYYTNKAFEPIRSKGGE